MSANKKEQYFEFNGKYYGKGTIVKFKQHHLQNHHRGKGFYGQYMSGEKHNGLHGFLLSYDTTSFRNLGMTLLDEEKNEIYSEIEKIVVPHEVEYFPIKKSKHTIHDWEDDELMMWWVVYIAFMIFSAIFLFPLNLFLWAVASFVFWGCRYEKLKEYDYR